MNPSRKTSDEKWEDFQAKFRDVLQMQMQSILVRAKIPHFENSEVDSLFENLEKAQADLLDSYEISPRVEEPGQTPTDPVKLLEKRIVLLEKKFDLLLDHLHRLETKLNDLPPKIS